MLALARVRALLRRNDVSHARRTTEQRPAPPNAERFTPASLPCRRERERILLDLLPDRSTTGDLDLPLLARLTPGYDSSTLQRLVSELRADADAEERAPTMSDAARALERLAGQEGRRPRLLEPDERLRAAHRVAGHATIAWTRGLIDHKTTVSILDDDPVWWLREPVARATTDGRATREGTLAALDTVLAGPIGVTLLSEEREWELDETMLRAVVLASRFTGAPNERPSWPGRARNNGRGGPSVSGQGGDDHEVRTLLEQRQQIVRETLRASTPQLRQLVTLLIEEESVDERSLAALFERG